MNEDPRGKDPPQPGEDRTVFVPGGSGPTEAGTGGGEPGRRGAGEGIRVGDVLNHIFEVKRFIARGGMGEVFEGCNVSSEERVAIKVMLPSLAQDPNVIAMFRKEARTLTRLQHEALVQYRVLAQEPQLGVLYIVTEYIDGVNLSEALGTLRPEAAEMEALLRRLASGLRAAHALGAIHRDMSPDNVLLEGGRLASAKIIDFGIAKDLDPGSATVVGDGFAGKLNYVAPEQLGDFGREIGPWTDVYSLGLVMLAVAGGRDVKMGGSLVDAVDKRRAGADLSAAPERLRPVLEKMLRPNPADRFRSMDEVLSALDSPVAVRAASAGASGAGQRRPAKTATALDRPPKGVLIGAAAGVGALGILGAAYLLSRGGDSPPPPIAERTAPAPKPATAAEMTDAARAAIDSALPSVGCSWLDIVDIESRDGRVAVRMVGVAGTPAEAQGRISQALSSRGLSAADIDFSEVAQISRPGCYALDTFRQVRATEGTRLSVPSRTFEIEPIEGQEFPRASKAVTTVAIGNPAEDLAVAGIDPSGRIDALILGREALREGIGASKKGEPVADMGEDRFRLTSIQEHVGWSGVLLLTGKGPFERDLVAPSESDRTSGWQSRFLAAARERGWRAEMVWFKSVDERPD